MALMILITLYGYFRPYSWTASNLLEVTVLVDFLVMLLVRSDPAIVELNSLIPLTNVSSLAEFGDCHADQETGPPLTTSLTKILTAFYYIPLVLFALAILFTILFSIRNYVLSTYNQRAIQQAKKALQRNVSDINLTLVDEPLISTTVIKMDETTH